MAQTFLYGTDASVTFVSGGGCAFRAFSLSVSQRIARAVGFGMGWVNKKGTGAKEAVGNVGGPMTNGTTSDKPGVALIVKSGVAMTLTFATGCTMSLAAIFANLNVATDFEAESTTAYSFEADGTGVTETWATT